MTPVAIGIVAGLALLQAAIAAPRQSFTTCLKDASSKAETQQVAAEQYSAFVTQQCQAQGAALKSALIAFDVKNGVKRAQATSDAQLQLDDYVAMSAEKYESRSAAKKPQAQPVQASAPVQPSN